MSDLRDVIEAFHAMLNERDRDISETGAALASALERNNSHVEALAMVREDRQALRARVAGLEGRLASASSTIDAMREDRTRAERLLGEQISGLRGELKDQGMRAALLAQSLESAREQIERSQVAGWCEGFEFVMSAEHLARGLAFALAIATYRATEPKSAEIEIVPWNECPECGRPDTRWRFLCADCRCTGEYCSTYGGCSRLEGHTGPHRKRRVRA